MINLREAGKRCNRQNAKVWAHNTSGFTGVTWNKRAQNWTARIKINQKTVYIGCSVCKLEAALLRCTFEEWCPEWSCDKRNINRTNVETSLRHYINTGELL